MKQHKVYALICCIALLCCASCVVQQRQIKSSALDFLYPDGSEAIPPTDVNLTIPIRVGLGFAPAGASPYGGAFDEIQKQALLERVAEAFDNRDYIRFVEVVPGSYLETGGGFENLDKLVSAFGIDVMALISYDQFQFSETGKSSWAYWTLIGAYVVKGEKNETRTMMDAVVYDIPSRAMLFHASGQSSQTGRSTPVDQPMKLRQDSEASFASAIDDLIANLDTALDSFAEQAASGTIRGEGTPAIAMVDEAGQPVNVGGGGFGGGAIGGVELMLVAMLLLAARRRRPV
jgi:rhombotail lipoprotein